MKIARGYRDKAITRPFPVKRLLPRPPGTHVTPSRPKAQKPRSALGRRSSPHLTLLSAHPGGSLGHISNPKPHLIPFFSLPLSSAAPSRLRSNGASGAAIQCHTSRAAQGGHGQVRAPRGLHACSCAAGLAPPPLLRQDCPLAEGRVVGGAEQGGALRGPEGYGRWPVHVSSVDDLRMAVKEVICDSETERQKNEEAVIEITVEESLRRYCQRIRRPYFWGGESELLWCSLCITLFSAPKDIILLDFWRFYPKFCLNCVGSRSLSIFRSEYREWGNGFIPIAAYGLEFTKNSKQGKKRVPVRLLYSGRNHYDSLV